VLRVKEELRPCTLFGSSLAFGQFVQGSDPITLLLFAAVVRTGSFSAAALEMGLVKSSVSKRIAALEGALGVKLLRRTTRKVIPTSEGLRVYESAAQVVVAYQAAERALDFAAADNAGIIRISAPVTFAHMFLVESLREFLNNKPKIKIELTTDDRFVDVVTGGFDLVIRIGHLPQGDYTARKLADGRFVICAAPSYLRERGTPARPADLRQHNCLRYRLIAASAEWQFLAEAVHRPIDGNFAVSDGTVLRQAALSGIGLAVLPSFMVERELANGELVEVLEGLRRAKFGIYAVHADGSKLAQRVRKLVEHLVRAFGDRNWVQKGLTPDQANLTKSRPPRRPPGVKRLVPKKPTSLGKAR
jgi:DNA-binding transcriptional LysR family regulator